MVGYFWNFLALDLTFEFQRSSCFGILYWLNNENSPKKSNITFRAKSHIEI